MSNKTRAGFAPDSLSHIPDSLAHSDYGYYFQRFSARRGERQKFICGRCIHAANNHHGCGGAQSYTRGGFRAYPVNLHGMITSIDATSMPSPRFFRRFFHDSTGSIYIEFPAGMKDVPTPGTLVDVQGQTGPGLFAPIIAGSISIFDSWARRAAGRSRARPAEHS